MIESVIEGSRAQEGDGGAEMLDRNVKLIEVLNLSKRGPLLKLTAFLENRANPYQDRKQE